MLGSERRLTVLFLAPSSFLQTAIIEIRIRKWRVLIDIQLRPPHKSISENSLCDRQILCQDLFRKRSWESEFCEVLKVLEELNIVVLRFHLIILLFLIFPIYSETNEII